MDINKILETAPMSYSIYNSIVRARAVLETHSRISVSVSGGSDSDTVLDLLELVKPDDCEIRYIYFDTGLELTATKRHLDELEVKYGIKIERRRAKVTVAAACAKFGVPFISKDASEVLERLQHHGFDWNDTFENSTAEKYGRCKSALEWYFDRRKPSVSGKVPFSINKYALLRDFIMNNPPDFAISDKCCDYAKKAVSSEWESEYNPDLTVNGMRRAEGGRRAGSLKTCFSTSKSVKPDSYRPIWYWSDKDKALYKEWRGLRYSDCYEVWNLKRTGCCGCSCNSKAEQELAVVEQYEPQLAKAARAIFGASYDYRRRYVEYKELAKKALHTKV